MTEWWNEMHSFQQAMFVIACAATLFMIVQIIMLAIGMGGSDASFDGDVGIDGGGDFDAGGDVDTINDGGIGFTIFGLRVLSVRSALAFLAIGGWLTFVLFYPIGFWSLIPGIAGGVAAAFAVAAVFKAVGKMQNSGNIKLSNTVGKSAEVYLTVPPLRSGNGKVNIYVQERYEEFDAVTDSAEPIKTGAKVKVVGTLNEGLVVVAPFGADDKQEQP